MLSPSILSETFASFCMIKHFYVAIDTGLEPLYLKPESIKQFLLFFFANCSINCYVKYTFIKLKKKQQQ